MNRDDQVVTDLTPHLAALRHGATLASLNFDIWWVYKSKEHRPKYVSTMNRYLGFFDTSIHAHFVAMLIALYPLFETRKDTFNVPIVLKILEKEGRLAGQRKVKVEMYYAEAMPIWRKVSVLRNEAFAHRSKSLTIAQIFEKASIKPDELKHLIDLTKKLINLT